MGNKIYRILDLYIKLSEGKIVNKARRITDADMRKVGYEKEKNGHSMKGLEDTLLSNSEILAVSKILLESRAFTKIEINSILYKIINGCVPEESMKLVNKLIDNEKIHYKETRHGSYIDGKLWGIAQEIGSGLEKNNLLEMTYQKQDTSTDVVKYVVQPLAILFSEYYFYLNANIVEKMKGAPMCRNISIRLFFELTGLKNTAELRKRLR